MWSLRLICLEKFKLSLNVQGRAIIFIWVQFQLWVLSEWGIKKEDSEVNVLLSPWRLGWRDLAFQWCLLSQFLSPVKIESVLWQARKRNLQRHFVVAPARKSKWKEIFTICARHMTTSNEIFSVLFSDTKRLKHLILTSRKRRSAYPNILVLQDYLREFSRLGQSKPTFKKALSDHRMSSYSSTKNGFFFLITNKEWIFSMLILWSV